MTLYTMHLSSTLKPWNITSQILASGQKSAVCSTKCIKKCTLHVANTQYVLNCNWA